MNEGVASHLCAEKTRAMVILGFPAASQVEERQLRFEGEQLSLHEHIKIWESLWTMSCATTPTSHYVGHQTSQRVAALRRVADFLDSRGILTLYKAQIRPYMEYGDVERHFK